MRKPDDTTGDERDNVRRFPVRLEHVRRELGAISDELRQRSAAREEIARALDAAEEAPLTNPRAIEMMANVERFRAREDHENTPPQETIRTHFLLWHPDVRAQKLGNLHALRERADRMAAGTRDTLGKWRTRQEADPDQIERVSEAADRYAEEVRGRIRLMEELETFERTYQHLLLDLESGMLPRDGHEEELRRTAEVLEGAIATLTAERFVQVPDPGNQQARRTILEQIAAFRRDAERARRHLGE